MPKSRFLVSIATAVTLMSTFITSAQSEPQPVQVRILSTSDVHGQFSGRNFFTGKPVPTGFVHLADTIVTAKAEADVSLLIDNGDLIQGSPMTDWMVAAHEQGAEQLPLAAAMNQLGYDVANLGNHEFNYGLGYLAKAYAGANFPVISANIQPITPTAAANLPIQPWVLLERSFDWQGSAETIKIAVVGVLPVQIMQWDAHHLSGQISVEPMLDAVKRSVAEAQQAAADVIVLAAHAGMPKHSAEPRDSEQDLWALAHVPGIDAIVFGHQHDLFPGTDIYDQLPSVDAANGLIAGIPATQPGLHGSHLGVIDLELVLSANGWEVVSGKSHLRAAEPKRNEQFSQHFAEAELNTAEYMRQPIGYSPVELSHELARLQPTLSMQLIHQAQLWYAKRLAAAEPNAEWTQLPLLSAAAPFHAAVDQASANAHEYTRIAAGDISIGDIGDLYRYPNTLDIVKVTGKELKLWLERSAEGVQSGEAGPWSHVNAAIPSYQFDTFFGIEYMIDSSQPVSQRVTINGVEDDDLYAVVTNNYRANGGGDFAGLNGDQIVVRSPDQIQHILIEYIKQLGEGGFAEALVENWKLK